jgi:serine/threonine protein kinase
VAAAALFGPAIPALRLRPELSLGQCLVYGMGADVALQMLAGLALVLWHFWAPPAVSLGLLVITLAVGLKLLFDARTYDDEHHADTGRNDVPADRAVTLAWDGTTVALDLDVANNKELDALEPPRERVLQDARALARLDHPNIPVVLDVVEDDSRTWMVPQAAPFRFPYRSLGDVVRNDGPLPPQRAAQVGAQILSALRAAHAVGVLHGNISPVNVLLGPGNRAVLTGFGMASEDDGPAAPETPAESPCYLAPECASGQPITPAADLWSLGATLYVAVEGRPPFSADAQAAARTAVISGYPDPPSCAGPLWPVISGLLRKDPAARPDDAALDWLLRRVAGSGDAGPVPPAESSGPRAGAAPAPGGPPEANHHGAAQGATAPPPAEATGAGRDGPVAGGRP